MKKNKLAAVAMVAAVLGVVPNEPALSQESNNSYSISSQYDGPVCVYLEPSQGNLDVKLEWASFRAYDKLNLTPGVVYALSVPVKGSLGSRLIVKTNRSLTMNYKQGKCENLPNVSTNFVYLNWQNQP